MASCEMRIDRSSGKSSSSRFEICSGDQPLTPLAVPAMGLVAPDERSLPRPFNLSSLGIVDLAFQPFLDVLAQTRVLHELGRLVPSGRQLGLPLRD